MFAWFFLTALYLQLVLAYSPLQVGLAFLPGNLVMGAMSIGPCLPGSSCASAFGHRSAWMIFASLGLVLLARAPVDGNFVTDILPSMILLGLGEHDASSTCPSAAMGVGNTAGLASGLVNTSFMMGGALAFGGARGLAAFSLDVVHAAGRG